MDNNRLKKTFLFHLRSRTVRLPAIRFTYTWGLGGSSVVLITLLMATGVMLKFLYAPFPDLAYDSIVILNTSVRFGRFIRNVHHWSANLLVVVVFLHMLRVFFTGAYQQRRRTNWWVGLMLFGAVLLSNLTGYLLPWDQLSYWAVTICAAMLAYLPVVGVWLQDLFIGGKELGRDTLSNFYALHTAILPAVLIVFLPYHFWRIRNAGGLAAASKKTSHKGNMKDERIDVIPHLVVRELAMAASVAALVMLMAAFWDAPLGSKANPGLSPNPTKAPWYFAGLQELLLHFNPVVVVTIVFPSIILSLVSLPFLPCGDDTSGIWFGTRQGVRSVITATAAGVVFTLLWVVGYSNGLTALTWVAPLAAFLMLWGGFVLQRSVLNATIHETVQGAFAFLVSIFVVLTFIGIWFRGASMMLRRPW